MKLRAAQRGYSRAPCLEQDLEIQRSHWELGSHMEVDVMAAVFAQLSVDSLPVRPASSCLSSACEEKRYSGAAFNRL